MIFKELLYKTFWFYVVLISSEYNMQKSSKQSQTFEEAEGV